ncbi:MAG: glycosyltransferase family 2 protein, partial [Chloroflexota bacterium]
MTAIGVVIPNLNGVRFLPTCLDALRRQTLPPAEIVVVDDGSRDASLDLLAKSYPEVRVVPHADTLGVARAFNDGIQATTSPIVALLN